MNANGIRGLVWTTDKIGSAVHLHVEQTVAGLDECRQHLYSSKKSCRRVIGDLN